MNDSEFLEAAVAELSDETRAAAIAILTVQSVLGVRFDPARISQIADAYRAPRGEVRALMGWVHDDDRPGSHIDILTPPRARPAPRPEDRGTVLAMAISRTLSGR